MMLDTTTTTTTSDQGLAPLEVGMRTPASIPSKTKAPIDASVSIPVISKDVVGASSTVPEAIAASWGALNEAEISSELFDRMFRLASAPNGWRGPRTLALRVKSISEFLMFWKIIKNHAVEPELALAPDGSLQAYWYKTDKDRLDIIFRDGRVLFGLFASKSVLEGAETPATLAALLLSHPAKPLQWSPR